MIKSKSRAANLSQFSDDITKYLTVACNNLWLITVADDSINDHNDLLTYIFNSLSSMNIPPFKEQVQKWHIEYLEHAQQPNSI